MLVISGGIAAGSESTSEVYRTSSGSSKLGQRGYTGAGQTVAIIDTGVANVAGLDGKLIHQENLSAAPPEGDQYGHGTFVAGIVHATAPDARLVSVKLSGANGSVEVTQVLAAIQWVVAHKDTYSIDVVNLSFGTDSKESWRTSLLNYAVQRAWDAGIVVVASAGNLGNSPGTVTKPADDPLILSVGAASVQSNGDLVDDTIPSFNSRGPTQDGLSKPDLVAPGTSLVSLRAPGSTIDTNYPGARVGENGFRGSGTSFAAPLVAGVAAQLLQASPSSAPDEIKFAVLSTATAIGGDPAALGAGTLRALRAAQALGYGHANRGVGRSNGRGSLEASRGSHHVAVETVASTATGDLAVLPVIADGNETGALTPDTSTATANDSTLRQFDPAAYMEHGWTASQWGASQWGASQWGASQWGASQWGASQWGASQWWASQWG